MGACSKVPLTYSSYWFTIIQKISEEQSEWIDYISLYQEYISTDSYVCYGILSLQVRIRVYDPPVQFLSD